MNARAITGSFDQVTERITEMVEQGLTDWYSFIFHPVNEENDVWTLVWTPIPPKPKKERKQPSAKRLNEKATEYDLYVQRKDDGYEIIPYQGKYKQIAFAKTIVGIQRKLTKEIDKIQMKRVELACFKALPVEEQLARIESGQFSYH